MAHDSHETGLSALVKALIAIACIGAINWGLIGFFNWNLVDAIFGGGSHEQTSTASRVIYALVGLSGLVTLFAIPRISAPSQHRLDPAPHSR
jgi:uncharacterized membrane protein YuzA (DUF378 family)